MQPSWVRSQSSTLIERDIWLESFPFVCLLKIQNAKRQGMKPCEGNIHHVLWTWCEPKSLIVWTREVGHTKSTNLGLGIMRCWGLKSLGMWLCVVPDVSKSKHSYMPITVGTAASSNSQYCMSFARLQPSGGRNVSDVTQCCCVRGWRLLIVSGRNCPLLLNTLSIYHIYIYISFNRLKSKINLNCL
jgi:hypothetical protein